MYSYHRKIIIRCKFDFIPKYINNQPDFFPSNMSTALLILAISIILFVSGKFRSDMVALCSLLALIVFDILTPAEALSGFSNTVIVMMVGLFIVGGAIFRTGLAKMISGKLIKLAGKSELKLFLLTILVTSIIGAFVSNTGTVALMMPIVISMAMSAGISPGRLLMPMAFASSMGGMLTLIGTPPNLVISEALENAGFEALSFFSFTPVGIVCIFTGVVFMIPLSKLLSKKDRHDSEKQASHNKSLQQLSKEYQLSDDLFRVKVPSRSPIVNKRIGELDISNKYNIGIVEIRREHSASPSFFKTINQSIAGPDSIIFSKDILYIKGNAGAVEDFVTASHLILLDGRVTEEKKRDKMVFNQIGIAELIIMPNSRLINAFIRNSGFRTNYGLNVLGIRRNKDYILKNISDEKIEPGDTLLVQGTWDNIGKLSGEFDEWVVVGQPLEEASKVTLDHKAPLAAAVMMLMVLAMAFNLVPPVAAVLIAAVLMVAFGCLRNTEEAYKTINWESIVLIAAMMPMSIALEKTGVSKMISDFLVTNLGGMGPTVLLAGIYFTASLMTMVISNTATAILVAPIALKAAMDMNLSPMAFMFAVTVGTSMCFASPFSTPPNALVMSAGKYTFMDYIKVGVPLQIGMGIVMVFVLPALFGI